LRHIGERLLDNSIKVLRSCADELHRDESEHVLEGGTMTQCP
jgi:hypothetical protein